MKLVSIDRLAFQWRLKLKQDVNVPTIKAISCDYIEFSRPVTHADLSRIGPGEFVLCVGRDQYKTHTPIDWQPVETRVGSTLRVSLVWQNATERAAFMRDMLLARQSELFSPAGV